MRGGSIPNQTEQQSVDAEADLEGGDVDKTPVKGTDLAGSYGDEGLEEETNLNKVGLFENLYNTIEGKSTLGMQSLFAGQNDEESTHLNHPICGASCSHGEDAGHTLPENETWKGVNTLTNNMAAGYYYLTADVELTDTWEPADGVVLCLNGKTITANFDNNAIGVKSGNFTLTDCAQGNNAGKIIHGKKNDTETYTGCGIYVSDNRTFSMFAGNVSDNSAECGGGVHVYGGTFTMSGGSISGNNAGYDGGGVYVNSNGTFTMSGGSITENEATQNGGGVVVYGEFNMEDGTITGNETSHSGGGVYVSETFNMSGGSITGNKATTLGGGVYVNYGTFTVSGKVNITNNVKGGIKGEDGKYTGGTANNVYLPTDKTITIGGSGLSNGAKIGITTYSVPTSDESVKIASGQNGCNIEETTMNALYPDAGEGNYHFELNDSSTEILMVAGAKPHKHYLCGGSDCNKVGHSETTETEFTAWTSNNSLPSEAGYYYLTKDVTLYTTWTPTDGTVLCLNGCNITAQETISVISVKNVTFTLTDCSKGGVGKVTHKKGYRGRGVLVDGGTFHMYGGSICGNTAAEGDRFGGGVRVYTGGTFHMYGGSIANNENASGSGGGVCMSSGKFTMSGGSITGNNAGNGGGVYVRGSFTVSNDVKIKGNFKGNNQNNVYLTLSDTITIGTGGLTAGAEIGVTTESAPTANRSAAIVSSDAKKGDEKYFKSDTGCCPAYMNGGIFLYKSQPHIHPTCGAACGDSDNHSDMFWNPISSADDLKEASSGYYYLTENVELSSTWNINNSAKNVVLCLNGYTIQMNGNTNIVIYVHSGNNLTLTDCSEGESGKVTHAVGKTGSGVGVASGSTFTLYGGSISGNETATGSGGGVLVYGTFNMCGGSISGNKAGSNGGGVYMYDGTFKLQNGSITENYAGGTLNTETGVYENGKDNNVYLRSGKMIDVSGLEANAGKIGVTTQDTPADGSPVAISTGAKDGVDYSEIFTPDVKDKDYTITSSGENVYLTAHTHNWAYSVSSDGATITAACDGCGKSGSVTIAKPADLIYDGSDKAATVTKSDWLGDDVPDITYSPDGTPKNAGTYTASITVGGKTASVEYTIQPKEVTPTINVIDADNIVYNGQEQNPDVTVKDGENIIPSTEYEVSYSNNIYVGTATVTVKNTEGGNYTINETSENFTIQKGNPRVSVTGLSDDRAVSYGDFIELKAEAVNTETNGTWTWTFDENYFIKIESNANARTIKLQAVKAGTLEGDAAAITATYNSDNYWGKNCMNVNNIGKKVLTQDDLNGIPENLTKVYDGTDKHTESIGLSVKEKVNNTGLNITVDWDEITYNSTEAGEETSATLSLSGIALGPNYEFASGFDSITVPARITKATLTAGGTGTASGTYGAKLSELTVSGLTAKLNDQDVDGTWKLSGDTVPKVGDADTYTATFIPTTGAGNYEVLTKDDVTLNIAKATIDTSNVKWSDTKTFAYDGNAHEVTLTGLPEGVTATYANNEKTYVGNYTAKATLNYDTDNYVLSDNIADCHWSITAVADPATIVETATVTKGGNKVDLSRNVTGAKGYITYTIKYALNTCSIEENGVFTSGNGAGTCTVTVTVANKDVDGDGISEYTGKTGTIEVTVSDKANAGVSFEGEVATNKTYGDKDFVIKAKADDAGENGSWTWSSSKESVLQVTGTGETATIKVIKPGTATITAKYESDTTKGEYTTAEITVAKRTITIKANDKTMTVGGTVPTFDVTYDGFVVDGENAETVFETQPTASTTADGKTVGTYDITVTAPTFKDGMGDKYEIDTISKGTLTVKRAASGGHTKRTDVITKDKVTTAPAEVKNETKTDEAGNKVTTATATVSVANQKEIIKQVKDNKSEEIVINVSEKDIADGASLEINLDK